MTFDTNYIIGLFVIVITSCSWFAITIWLNKIKNSKGFQVLSKIMIPICLVVSFSIGDILVVLVEYLKLIFNPTATSAEIVGAILFIWIVKSLILAFVINFKQFIMVLTNSMRRIVILSSSAIIVFGVYSNFGTVKIDTDFDNSHSKHHQLKLIVKRIYNLDLNYVYLADYSGKYEKVIGRVENCKADESSWRKSTVNDYRTIENLVQIKLQDSTYHYDESIKSDILLEDYLISREHFHTTDSSWMLAMINMDNCKVTLSWTKMY